jgi:bifunctional UDP-N-acetylglucosamine pyrophosphorylase/glucosamine-1-phosphate N-acetyltransferase
MSFITVIMAAGKGSRMHSSIPKPLHTIAGKTLVSYVIDAAQEAGHAKLIIVVGSEAEDVRVATAYANPIYTIQETPSGTGGAIQVAIPLLADSSAEDVLILSGDNPLITGAAIRALLLYHQNANNAATVLSARVPDPFGYGRIIRNDDGTLLRIREEKDATENERTVNEVNSGTYVFKKELLIPALRKLTSDNAQHEYYLTDVIGILHGEGHVVGAHATLEYTDILGVNTQEQLTEVTEIIRKRNNV